MDRAQFDAGMKLLSAVFDVELPPERVLERRLGYRLLLDDLDGELFVGACRLWANTMRFFPKPAELRETIEAVRRRREYEVRADEYAERLALTEAREGAEDEIRRGVWDAGRGAFVRSGESAEAIYERWRRLALAQLEEQRAARERGEEPGGA